MTGRVVTVVGARGGAGASTVAALLARCAAAGGGRVALVDLDHTAGGVEVLLGVEGTAGARWPDLAQLVGRLEPDELRGVLPTWHGVEVLGHDRRGARPVPPEVLGAVWPALVEGCRTVVVDLPARCADGVRDPVLRSGSRVLVTTQDVPGVAAALAAVEATGGPPDHLVLRSRRRARVAPAEVAHVVGAPVTVRVGEVGALPAAVDQGLGPVVPGSRSPLQRQVARLAQVLGA